MTSVESILMLDRLRQSVAVKELLQSAGRPLMRKTASVPNFSQVSHPSRVFDDVVERKCFRKQIFLWPNIGYNDTIIDIIKLLSILSLEKLD